MARVEITPEYSAQSRSHPPNPALPRVLDWLKSEASDRTLDRVADLGCGKLRHLRILRRISRKALVLVDTELQLNMPHYDHGQAYSVRSVVGRTQQPPKLVAETFEQFDRSRKVFDSIFCIAVFDVVTPNVRRELVSAASRHLHPDGFFIVIAPRNDHSILRRCTASNQYADGHIFSRGRITTFYRNFESPLPLLRLAEQHRLALAADLSNYRQLCLVLKR